MPTDNRPMKVSNTKFYAMVPRAFQKDGVHFLVLEHDSNETGGWFLFYHDTLSTPCLFDGWYETKEKALDEALGIGVEKDAWHEFVE